MSLVLPLLGEMLLILGVLSVLEMPHDLGVLASCSLFESTIEETEIDLLLRGVVGIAFVPVN